MLSKLTLNEIYQEVKEYMLKNFDFNLDLPININYHLTNAVAQVVLPNPRIELSGIILKCEYLNKEAFTEILEHEAIHYYLWSLSKPFQDGSEDFEYLLRLKKLPSTHYRGFPVANTLLLINQGHRVYISRYL